VLEKYAGEPVCRRRLRDEDILRMGLDRLRDGIDDKCVGESSKKLETVNLNLEKDEFKIVKMNDYSKLLIVLCVLKELGLVHRDIRPANVLRDKNSGKLTLIDFAFCCDEDEEICFAGGVSCASDHVLRSIKSNPSQKFKMCWRDDFNSWVRCWMLISNEKVAEGHRHVQRSDNLSTMASELRYFWSDVGHFPKFGSDISSVLGVEDVWELSCKAPSLISFISYFEGKDGIYGEDFKPLVGLNVFRNMFKVVLEAVLDYLLSKPSDLSVEKIIEFLGYFDSSSLIGVFDKDIFQILLKIKLSISGNEINEMKKLRTDLDNLKMVE
jgi:hypothetical protein